MASVLRRPVRGRRSQATRAASAQRTRSTPAGPGDRDSAAGKTPASAAPRPPRRSQDRTATPARTHSQALGEERARLATLRSQNLGQ